MKIIETNLPQTTLEESLALKVPADIIGQPEGVTPLDVSTKIPVEYLPDVNTNYPEKILFTSLVSLTYSGLDYIEYIATNNQTQAYSNPVTDGKINYVSGTVTNITNLFDNNAATAINLYTYTDQPLVFSLPNLITINYIEIWARVLGNNGWSADIRVDVSSDLISWTEIRQINNITANGSIQQAAYAVSTAVQGQYIRIRTLQTQAPMIELAQFKFWGSVIPQSSAYVLANSDFFNTLTVPSNQSINATLTIPNTLSVSNGSNLYINNPSSSNLTLAIESGLSFTATQLTVKAQEHAILIKCSSTRYALAVFGNPRRYDTNDDGVIDEAAIPQSFNNTRNATLKTLTDGATISWDLNANQVAQVTLAGNRTLANPANMIAGATYILLVKQDATGSRTLTFSSNYKFTATPTLSTAANKVDIISFVCDGIFLYGSAAIGF